MQDIVINGISINTLIEQRKALQQGANEFVSNNIEQVKKLVKQIVEAESADEAEKLSKEAFELLEAAHTVAGAAGIQFFLPYHEEYGSYDEDEILSSILYENNEHLDMSYKSKSYARQLYSLLGSMESDSRDWHSSNC